MRRDLTPLEISPPITSGGEVVMRAPEDGRMKSLKYDP